MSYDIGRQPKYTPEELMSSPEKLRKWLNSLMLTEAELAEILRVIREVRTDARKDELIIGPEYDNGLVAVCCAA